MPLKSKAQYRKLRVTNPALAKEFLDATPDFDALPEHVPPKKRVTKKKRRRTR